MQVRTIREQLKAALEGLGYRAYDTLPENGQLPLAAVSWPDEIRYHKTAADSSELDLDVTVCVSLSDFAKAQREIDDAMSHPGGFASAIEAYDPGSAWRSAVVMSAGNVRQETIGTAEALACDFNIIVRS